MKILVVSGFLGAGKTTFIKELAKNVNLEFVVLENEYADINVDSSILQDEKLKIWEMSEGCICCSMLGDFRATIKNIYETIEPEYLIIEPTGIGLLSSVLNGIKNLKDMKIEVLAPICFVDVTCFWDYLKEFRDSYKNQILNAKKIILTKLAYVDGQELLNIKKEIEKMGFKHEIIAEDYRTFQKEWWLDILNTNENLELIDLDFKFSSHPNLKTYSTENFNIKTMDSFGLFMDKLLSSYFGKVYRAKGFLCIEGFWGEFELVNKNFEMTACPPQKEKLILIGNNLDEEKLDAFLRGDIYE